MTIQSPPAPVRPPYRFLHVKLRQDADEVIWKAKDLDEETKLYKQRVEQLLSERKENLRRAKEVLRKTKSLAAKPDSAEFAVGFLKTLRSSGVGKPVARGRKPAPAKSRGKNIDAKMFGMITRETKAAPEDCHLLYERPASWRASQLNGVAGTVCETHTWKNIIIARRKVERAARVEAQRNRAGVGPTCGRGSDDSAGG